MNRINKAILAGVIITGILSSNILAAELEDAQNKSS